MRRMLRRVTDPVRAPMPRIVRDARLPAVADARAMLASDRDIASSVGRLGTLWDASKASSTLIIPSGLVGPRIVWSLILLLSRTSRVSLGLPHGIADRSLERWARLAMRAGSEALILGDAGWDRVELGDRSEIMGYVDLPAEIAPYGDVVLVQSDRPSMLAAWRGIVHPNSAARAWPSGSAGDAELALAFEARYVTLFMLGSSAVVTDTRDRIAAQLLTAAMARIREEAAGVEALGPWEEPLVQSLVALAGGIALPSQLVIRASVADTAVLRRAQRLAELIGCTIEWRHE
jgi:hypothetical protein